MSFTAWNDVDWHLVNKRIARYQRRIFKAAKNKEKNKVQILQKLLLHSLDARLLAVYRVTTPNKGKRTAGVDGKIYSTPQEKIKLLNKVRLDGESYPIRRTWIPKPGKEQKRPLSFPVLIDRAKQTLVAMALDPEWEAQFEANSYGFRKGRNCLDAIETIFGGLANKRKLDRFHKYILNANIKSCFDQIDHDYLLSKLDTIPMVQKQVNAWLKAGIMEGYTRTQNDYVTLTNTIGTPQGDVISPLLSNIALNGLQNYLNKWILTKPYPYGSYGRSREKISALTFVRYADNFLVIHPDESIILEVREICRTWLQQNPKLELNDQKTSIVRSDQGCNYLGFTIVTIMRNGRERVKIYPSKEAQNNICLKVREIVQTHKAAAASTLINALNPVILGWGNYYKYSECSEVFSNISHKIHLKLRAWAFRRDRNNIRSVIKEKYFPSGKTYYFDGSSYQDNWILSATETTLKSNKIERFLPRLNWLKKRKWVKVEGNSSVYDGNETYWTKRLEKYGTWSKA